METTKMAQTAAIDDFIGHVPETPEEVPSLVKELKKYYYNREKAKKVSSKAEDFLLSHPSMGTDDVYKKDPYSMRAVSLDLNFASFK